MAYVGKQPVVGNYSKLDDIDSGFNGSTTTFTLQVNGANANPLNEQNCMISISGVIQEPNSAYTISNSQITFTSAPLATDTFFGVVFGDALNIGEPSDATVSAAKLSSSFFVKNNQTLTNLSLTGSENALLVGTVTVSGTITIPSGSTVVIV
jgi:hypothetical protein|tara:strand:- start:36 stop:491 length:456 start_codon:yes stop_codon:yes gene_type:complete